MLGEENQLLKQIVEEFCINEIDPAFLKIEREGLNQELINSLVEKGFLGATAPQEYGGAGLDDLGYAVLLETLAKYSPSVAMYVFIQNSLFIKPILKYGSADLIQEIVPRIATGKVSGTMANYMVEGGQVKMDGDVISGELELVPNAGAKMFLVLAKAGDDSRLVLIDDGAKAINDIKRLGFRGLKFSKVAFSGSKPKAVLVEKGGENELRKIYNEASWHVSAIAIGMSNGAIVKAVDYAKRRQAFGVPLVAFQPIAFSLAKALSELRIYERFLYSISSPVDGMILKEVALEFARRAARLSLQVHGGYGFFEDSGIERFYRDSMMLKVLSGVHVGDLEELSRELIGPESAKY